MQNTMQEPRGFGRRGVVVAAAGTALALGLGGRAAPVAAQETAAAPANTAVWLKYNLNTATDEQFLGVPGAGDRMTREFKEYRPYASISQFRAEIGKYIAPEDVAALERYLFVPVSPNDADADTLQQLPGVTTDIAQALIAARPYDSADAFLTALGKQIPADLAAVARAYLEG